MQNHNKPKPSLKGALLMGLVPIIGIMAISYGVSRAWASVDPATFPAPTVDLVNTEAHPKPQKLVLAGGCFWCTEAVFENTPGVLDVVSGYAGDSAEKANYKLVSAGATRHAEAIEITFDPAKVSVGKLLQVFFSIAHDPTTLNRQGPDTGAHYRSAIFYADDDQLRVARAYIEQLDGAKLFDSPIVTTLEKLEQFFPAEDYHQDYARLNPGQPYIRQQALPKLVKIDKYMPKIMASTQPTTQEAK
jgi:peptide-methionine (S)-S-oxide reductase